MKEAESEIFRRQVQFVNVRMRWEIRTIAGAAQDLVLRVEKRSAIAVRRALIFGVAKAAQVLKEPA
jgi:hypothetical protein